MKRLLPLLFLLLAFAASVSAQVRPAGQIRFGPTDPTTCTPGRGQVFENTTSHTVKNCTATNTWTATGGSGTITGTLTPGTLPVAVTPTALGDSGITDDGSTVSVNRASMTIGTSNVIANFSNATPSISLGAGGSGLEINDSTHVITLTASAGVVLPTVTTGVWHGTVVGAAYGGFGADTTPSTGIALNTLGTFTFLSSSGTGNVARVDGPTFTIPTLGVASATSLAVGLGAVANPTTFAVGDTSSSSPRGIMSWQASNDTSSAHLHLRKSRGTFATPLIVAVNDLLGRVVYSGYDGASYLEMASIRATAVGTVALTRIPTKLEFLTATDAAPSVATVALTLNKDQSAVFAGTVTIPTPFTLGAVSVTATGTELNYSVGVTSAIQTQLGARLPLAGGTMAGDLLFNGVSAGSATLPMLSSFTGNTTQYEKVSQSAGLISYDALGSAGNIGMLFTPKGNQGVGISVGGGSPNLANAALTIAIGSGTRVLDGSGSSTDSTHIGLTNSSSGSKFWAVGVTGSGASASRPVGSFFFYDGTVGGTAFSISGVAGSPVNHLNIVSAITNTDPVIQPLGTDSNIGISVTTKGASGFKVTNTTDSTTTTSGALQVAGGAAIRKRVFIDGISASAGLQTAVLCQSSGGEMIADSVACLASSARFKQNIKPLTSGLDEVMKLRPISYNYKPEGIFAKNVNFRRERVGFTAEDVAKIDPRFVGYEADGKTPRTVGYEQMVPLLVKAIQEIQSEIVALRQQVKENRWNIK